TAPPADRRVPNPRSPRQCVLDRFCSPPPTDGATARLAAASKRRSLPRRATRATRSSTQYRKVGAQRKVGWNESGTVVHCSGKEEPAPMAVVASISQQIWDMKYRLRGPSGEPLDKTIEDTWRRVATALAAPERDPAL